MYKMQHASSSVRSVSFCKNSLHSFCLLHGVNWVLNSYRIHDSGLQLQLELSNIDVWERSAKTTEFIQSSEPIHPKNYFFFINLNLHHLVSLGVYISVYWIHTLFRPFQHVRISSIIIKHRFMLCVAVGIRAIIQSLEQVDAHNLSISVFLIILQEGKQSHPQK